MSGSEFDMQLTLIAVHSARSGPVRIETNDTSFVSPTRPPADAIRSGATAARGWDGVTKP